MGLPRRPTTVAFGQTLLPASNSLLVSESPLQGLSHFGLEPMQRASLYLNHCFKGHISKYSHILELHSIWVLRDMIHLLTRPRWARAGTGLWQDKLAWDSQFLPAGHKAKPRGETGTEEIIRSGLHRTLGFMALHAGCILDFSRELKEITDTRCPTPTPTNDILGSRG